MVKQANMTKQGEALKETTMGRGNMNVLTRGHKPKNLHPQP